MKEQKSRQIMDQSFLGESVSFIATNDRIRERVSNISHETDILERLVERSQPDDVFWDVGACLGIHTFTLAKHLPYGEVVAFEPMPSNRGILIDNKSVNQFDNVTVFREALADESGQRDFAIRESVQAGYGRHSFATGDYESIKTIPVDVQTGDGLLVRDSDVPRPNLIKIDVEGAGPLVVEGMKRMLSTDDCHTVIFETHRPNNVQPSHEDFGYTESDFVELVEDCGFEVEMLDNDYHFIGKKRVEHTSSLTIEDANFTIKQGDIASQSSDAIINSAGTTLRMGTGVAGALRDAGGDKLNEAAILEGPVDIGNAVCTPAFDLDANYVIHAASMPHYNDGNSTPDSIRDSVNNALQIAEQRECQSIVIPLVGCGLGGVPVATGARVIRDVIDSFVFESLNDVTVVAYTDEEYDIVNKIFD